MIDCLLAAVQPLSLCVLTLSLAYLHSLSFYLLVMALMPHMPLMLTLVRPESSVLPSQSSLPPAPMSSGCLLLL